MKCKISLGVVLLLLFTVIIITFLSTALFFYSTADNTPHLPSADSQQGSFYNDGYVIDPSTYAKLTEIKELIDYYYLYEIEDSFMIDSIISGYIYGLDDPYAAYYNTEFFSELTLHEEGKSAGVGIKVTSTIEGDIIIFSVVKGSPAEEAGVHVGDILKKVDDIDIANFDFYDVADMVSGKEGTTVDLTFLRGDAEIVLSVTRATFEDENVTATLLSDNIAKIDVSSFTENTYTQMVSCLDEMKAQGADKFIFDMRNNYGGIVESISDILDYLLPEGVMFTTYSTEDNQKEVFTSDASFFDYPMAVIVNSQTASAAELFAAALQDYERATVVGEVTFGKGTVCSIFTLSDFSGFQISTGYFDPPSGENFEGVGVIPDIEVYNDNTVNFYIDHDNDLQLQKAIETLK